jgi:WD40 repeat protein
MYNFKSYYFQMISSYDLTALSLVDASIGSLDIRCDVSKQLSVLAGTFGGEIIELTSENNTSSKSNSDDEARNLDLTNAYSSVLSYSHFSGELWGLAPHPEFGDIVATGGDDGTIRIWNLATNTLIKFLNLKFPIRTVSWHPTEDVLAVGFHETVKATNKKSAKKELAKAKAEVKALKKKLERALKRQAENQSVKKEKKRPATDAEIRLRVKAAVRKHK